MKQPRFAKLGKWMRWALGTMVCLVLLLVVANQVKYQQAEARLHALEEICVSVSKSRLTIDLIDKRLVHLGFRRVRVWKKSGDKRAVIDYDGPTEVRRLSIHMLDDPLTSLILLNYRVEVKLEAKGEVVTSLTFSTRFINDF